MKLILSTEFAIPAILTTILLGMAYHDGIILSYVAVLFYALIMLAKRKTSIRINVGIILFYLTTLFYFIGMFNQPMLYKANIEDMINIVTAFLILFIINQLDAESYGKSLVVAKITVVIVFTFLALFSIYKYYLLTKGVYLPSLYFNGFYAFGTALSSDNNMFSLAMLIGFIFSISLLKRESIRRKHKLFLLISTASMGVSIMFSGSRRAYVFLVIIFAISLLKWMKSFIQRTSLTKAVKSLYFILLISSILFSVMYMSGASLNLNKIINDPQIQTTIKRFSTIKAQNATQSFLPRADRWEYASEIIKTREWDKLLFGGGFDYLKLFTERFPTGVKEDYPHNPLLSSMLYSGLTGGIILLSLLVSSFYFLVKFRKQLGSDMIIIYFATFCYVFVSGNSIFSYKIYLFLCVLLISCNSIFRKKESSSTIKEYEQNNITAVRKLVKT